MIKKFVFHLIFSTLFYLGTMAQGTAGPKLSLNFSTVTGGTGGNQFKIGFSAGFFLKIGLNESLALRPEALYSTRGYKQHTVSGDVTAIRDTTITHNFSYVDFPLLLDIAVGNNVFMYLGPQIGYLANVQQKGAISVTTGGIVQTQTVDTSDIYGFRAIEYSIVLGGGYRFNFSLVTSLRFTYGVSSVYENGRRGHNLAFQVFVAYSFGNRESNKRGGVIYKQFD